MCVGVSKGFYTCSFSHDGHMGMKCWHKCNMDSYISTTLSVLWGHHDTMHCLCMCAILAELHSSSNVCLAACVSSEAESYTSHAIDSGVVTCAASAVHVSMPAAY